MVTPAFRCVEGMNHLPFLCQYNLIVNTFYNIILIKKLLKINTPAFFVFITLPASYLLQLAVLKQIIFIVQFT